MSLHPDPATNERLQHRLIDSAHAMTPKPRRLYDVLTAGRFRTSCSINMNKLDRDIAFDAMLEYGGAMRCLCVLLKRYDAADAEQEDQVLLAVTDQLAEVNRIIDHDGRKA